MRLVRTSSLRVGGKGPGHAQPCFLYKICVQSIAPYIVDNQGAEVNTLVDNKFSTCHAWSCTLTFAIGVGYNAGYGFLDRLDTPCLKVRLLTFVTIVGAYQTGLIKIKRIR